MRQMKGLEVEMESKEVTINIENYFKEHLPAYEVVEVRKKSEYRDDSHLYMVAAKKGTGEYAVWTCWNEKLQTLNHGHYGIKNLEGCHRLMEEFHCKVSGCCF